MNIRIHPTSFFIFILVLFFLNLLKAQNQTRISLVDSIDSLNNKASKLASSNIDSALSLNLSLYALLGDADSLAKSNLLAISGNLYYELAMYNQAVSYYIQCLAIRESLMDNEKVGNIKLNLGNTYYMLDQHEKALTSFYEALHHYQLLQIPPYLKIKDVFNSLGVTYHEIGPIDSADKYYNLTLYYITRGNGTGLDSLDILGNLGALHEGKGNWSLALDHHLRAAQIQERIHDIAGLSWSMHHIGLIQREKGLFGEAKKSFDKSYRLAIKSKKKEIEVDVSHTLAEWAFAVNNIDSAKKYFDIYFDQNRKLTRNKISRNIQETEAKYQLEKHEAARILSEEMAARSNAEAKAGRQLNYVLFGLLFMVSLSGAFGYHFYQQKRYINQMELQIKEKQLSELQVRSEAESIKAMLNGQEHERNRIARDLHDRVGNLLATLKLSLRREDINLNPQVELIDETVKEVREIAENLSSDQISSHGLIQAIMELKQSVEKSAGIKFQLYLNEETDKLDKTVALEVYRIVQELVSNTLKHAKASIISIQTNGTNQEFNLIYEDNGIGFIADKVQEGMGSRNIRSRVEFVNGKYHIDSQPGRGTIVILDIDA